jgi:repressor LexA
VIILSAYFNDLTAKQKKVYSAIETYIKLKGIPPTVREIGEMVGEKTPGAVQGILNRLEQKGVIKRQLGAARSIQLISESQMYANPVYIPEIKKISKRNIDDLVNIYNINKYQPVSPDFISEGDIYILLSCPDDSLSESGIKLEDMLLINTSTSLKQGDIVLVLYETHALLRYYYTEKDSDKIILKADLDLIGKEFFNPDEVRIIGKLDVKYTRY